MKYHADGTLNPSVGKIIHNLDLEGEAKATDYPQSMTAKKEDQSVSPAQRENQKEKDGKKITPSDYNPFLSENEPQSIPIASRILPEENFHLPHFSPWTIFGLLISLVGSIFLWLGISKDAPDNPPAASRDNNTESVQNVPQEKQLKLENRPTTTKNMPSYTPTPQFPPPIPSLPPYPDLKTAIFSEIRKNQNTAPLPYASTTPPQLPPTPPLPRPHNYKPLLYHVIIDYTGIEQYNRIKQQYPQILLVSVGNEMKIQFGVFYTEMEARQWSQFLTSQGLNNYILVSSPSNP